MTISYNEYPNEPVILENLSIKFMKQSKFIPIQVYNNIIKIAIVDINDLSTIDTLKQISGMRLEIVEGTEEDIIDAIERLYGSGRQSIETIIEEADKDIYELTQGLDDNIEHLKDIASEAPIIRLVNRLILNAVESGASDIHFEPFDNDFRVRYRIDGLLNEVESPPKKLQAAVISRIKIMAKLDIAERRLPQDGRIKLKIEGKEIDFRVSTLPSIFGESLVMRILDRESLLLDLKQIGFSTNMYEEYIELIAKPYGMVLVTGPTGSGKTSTLYTTLSKINSPEKKIITLEDPVEYQLQGINQIQVSVKIGLTFAGGLRAIVRQDPDIILVGEIRDKETAEIAIQSALTGHLIFSTLHTNDAAGSITRLLDMGVENFLLNSTILGILAQRLIRVNCQACKNKIMPEDRLLKAVGFSKVSGMNFYAGTGCKECRNTGFKGRIGIFELLKVDEDIRKLIIEGASSEKIKESAINKGMVTLRNDGLLKIKNGITTIPEILRVTLEI
ncbi:MAG: type II secretion system ATPase GspE [Desulfobacterales bacterium]|nr:type II secretion system ATPase GspE [Desulfobacterales bacterium]